MWECTPPLDSNPIKWRECSFAFSIAFSKTSFVKKSPSSIALLTLVKSWYTILPAPMLVWPTSELPICPSGRPTSSPLAWINVWGYSFIILSKLGVFEDAIALPSVFLLSPNPSIIIKATGFFIYVSP